MAGTAQQRISPTAAGRLPAGTASGQRYTGQTAAVPALGLPAGREGEARPAGTVLELIRDLAVTYDAVGRRIRVPVEVVQIRLGQYHGLAVSRADIAAAVAECPVG